MSTLIHLHTMTDMFRFFGSDHQVQHPLVAVVDFSKVTYQVTENLKITADFYSILFKDYHADNVRYGRKQLDFQDGSLMCMAPNQVIDMQGEVSQRLSGWGLFFHPDLIRSTTLNHKIKNYTFFSYEVNEALHLSVKEREVLTDCLHKIGAELQENIDVHSQSIIVSNIELFLNYCTRFYGRQFITRKSSNHAVVTQVENILSAYFKTKEVNGLPTVKHLAEQVHLSTSYLSDLLKKETGKSPQDHIHFYLIEEAKNSLINTDRSVGEIAYSLGFEYPQYFNKLFKSKTGMTPVEFRGK